MKGRELIPWALYILKMKTNYMGLIASFTFNCRFHTDPTSIIASYYRKFSADINYASPTSIFDVAFNIHGLSLQHIHQFRYCFFSQ